MFIKLRNKFLILNMTLISIVMIIAFSTVFFMTSSNIKRQDNIKLERALSTPGPMGDLRFKGDEHLNKDNKSNLQGPVPMDFSLSFNVLIDGDGNLNSVNSYIDMDEDDYKDLVKSVVEKSDTSGVVTYEGKRWMYRLDLLNSLSRDVSKNTTDDSSYYIITFLDVSDSYRTLTQLFMTFLGVGVLMAFVIFAISLYFANRSIKPISEVWDRQKQFIADASHELKTPIAVINANSDALLLNGEETVISQKKWIDYIKIETKRMKKLVEDLLYLAKTDNTDFKVEFMPFNLSDVVNDLILPMEAVVFEKNIKLNYNIEDNLILKSDIDKVKQIMLILIDNAIKYADNNGYISIEMIKLKNTINFSVVNSGSGIPKDEIPKIFDRFYRGDPSRNYENEGYGLGLSIAKVIAEKLDIKIKVDSIENKNTTFKLIFKI